MTSISKFSVFDTPVPELLVVDMPHLLPGVEDAIIREHDEERRKWSKSDLYRETLEFGKTFTALEEGSVKEIPLPDYLEKIRTRLFELFQDQLGLHQASDLDNTIVSIYNAGDGIKAHIDRAHDPAPDGKKRTYYFGDCILGYIVRPDTEESLYFVNPADKKSLFKIAEKAGRAFLFRGPLRSSWMHGLDKVHDKRISITFRQVLWKKV